VRFWKRRAKPKEKVFEVGYKCSNCEEVNWLRKLQEPGSLPVEMLPLRHECYGLVGPNKPLGIAYAFVILEIKE
jgi:hypothetical protein